MLIFNIIPPDCVSYDCNNSIVPNVRDSKVSQFSDACAELFKLSPGLQSEPHLRLQKCRSYFFFCVFELKEL